MTEAVLTELMNAPIVERTVLHEWPLSRIERLKTEAGGTVILKTQRAEASVERDFYRRVRHPSLLRPLADGSLDGEDWMALPDLGDTAEDWSSLTDGEIRTRVRGWQRVIAEYGDAPAFFDLSTPEKLTALTDELLPVLTEDEEGARDLAQKVRERLGAWYDAPTGLLHGDLKGENILASAEGSFVIDWQRPLLGPLPLEEELALLLAGRESAEVHAGLARLFLACWYGWAWKTCLPVPFVRGMAQKYAASVRE